MSRCVLTLGNFDGVHAGHQALVAAARRLADAQGARVVAATFDPFPSEALGGPQVARLLPLAERLQALRAAGADEARVLPADAGLLGQAPAEFAAGLVRDWHLVGWVEGPDFRFGASRAGCVELLARVAAPLGCRVEVLPRVCVRDAAGALHPLSSSLLRGWIAAGRVDEAAGALGRPVRLDGQVVRGEQRGRRLGFPTANLRAGEGWPVPGEGVYAARATLADGQCLPAAVSIGRKPVFHDSLPQAVVEAHLLGYQGGEGLYGQTLRLDFVRRLRGQEKYPDVLALQAAIREDIARTRSLVPVPPP